MQFTYEREGNDCWLTNKLIFIGSQVLFIFMSKGWQEESNETENVEVSRLLDYLKRKSLSIQNFSGLEDYLKENYPNLLPNPQLTERELITQLIRMVDQCMAGDPELVDWNMYKQAKLYLDPDLNENEQY
jgi:hypothetical protein